MLLRRLWVGIAALLVFIMMISVGLLEVGELREKMNRSLLKTALIMGTAWSFRLKNIWHFNDSVLYSERLCCSFRQPYASERPSFWRGLAALNQLGIEIFGLDVVIVTVFAISYISITAINHATHGLLVQKHKDQIVLIVQDLEASKKTLTK